MNIKALVLTSDSLRHKYLINKISENFNLVGLIQEKKGKYYNTQKEESDLIQVHFDRLQEAESKFFNVVKDIQIDTNKKLVNKNEINNIEVVEWAKLLKPDIIFLFGTGILKDIWLDAFPNKIINLHLGLSPFYRGSATLFWPFVYDELECIGVTIHIAAKKVDAGDIIHRIKPDIKESDNYYTINYKSIKNAIDIIPYISKKFINNEINLIKQNINQGKVFKKSDFNEKVLKKVIASYGKSIPFSTIEKLKKSNKCSC